MQNYLTTIYGFKK